MAMAANYRPSVPFNVAMKLLAPTLSKVQGVNRKTFADPKDVADVFYGSFRTFGGTERLINDVYALEDTATIDTWYRPDITGDCRIYICDTGDTYEVLGSPENVNMRNQYLRMKVRKVGGTA